MQITNEYENMELAYEYQDLATDILCSRGYNVNCYSSKKYQNEKGEGRNGIEIKNDRRMAETGNIYIETHEKKANADTWIESGILRKDNTKYWFIGDNEKAWLFHKRQLIATIKKENFKKVETATSLGILIPIKYIEQHPSLPLEIFDIQKEILIQENIDHIPYIE